MTAKLNLAQLSEDENRLVNALLGRIEARRSRNLLRASYYDGKRAIRQVGSVIPPQYYRLGLVLGWSAKAVDILARRCNLDGFVWPDGDIDSIGASKVWEDNLFGAESSSGLVSSLIHGVSFAVNTTGMSASEPDSMIHFKGAMDATGEWNSQARRMDNLLSITGWDTESGVPTSFALYLDGKTIAAERSGSGWAVDRHEHVYGVPVEALAYKPRIGRPFGSSRISRPVMSLHDQALRTVIRLEGHADVFSFPQMILLGADSSVFKNADGTTKASWQVALGRVFAIPDDDDQLNTRADVRQHQAASPQPHIDMLKQQAQLFSGETSIPLTSLGVSDMSNPTSADSYIASREDLIAEAEGATDDWSIPLRRSMIRALAIANGSTGVPDEWRTIDTKWRPPIYLSRAAQADAGSKQIGTVPWLAETEVGLELLGLDAQQIKRAMSDKRRMAGRGVLAALQQKAAGVVVDPAVDPAAPDAAPDAATTEAQAAALEAK